MATARSLGSTRIGRSRGPLSVGPVPPMARTLVGWFDAQDIDLLGNSTIADGHRLSLWRNKGSLGAAGDLVQTTENSKPTFKTVASAGKLRGLSSVYFPTTQEMTSGNVTAQAQPIKYALIVKVADVMGTRGVVDGNDATNTVRVFANGGNWAMNAGATYSDGRLVVADVYNELMFTFSGASSFIRENGTDSIAGNAGTGGLDGFTVGRFVGGSPLDDGEVVEWLIWAGTVPASTDIAAYFAAKYGSGWPQ